MKQVARFVLGAGLLAGVVAGCRHKAQPSVPGSGTNALVAAAAVKKFGDFEYCRVDSKIMVFRYSGTNAHVTVPDSIDGIPVTRIDCFGHSPYVSAVVIPASVTNIGTYTFCNCRNLTSVCFKGNAPSGGESAFPLCPTNLTVYYPSNATGWGASFGLRPTAVWEPGTDKGK